MKKPRGDDGEVGNRHGDKGWVTEKLGRSRQTTQEKITEMLGLKI
jgi:hypothetical protein